MVFWIIFFFVTGLYFLLISAFTIGWIILPKVPIIKLNQTEYTFISVIIALRNESAQMKDLAENLSLLDYPADKFEIIFVDDHSEDESLVLLKQYSFPNSRHLNLPPDSFGKKAALKVGVEKAKGEICLFTDADCRMSKNWLKEYNSFYQIKGKPDLIIGLVDIFPAKSFIQKIFRIDFLSLILSSAGAAAIKHPVMCNGANLAVKRNEYLKLNSLQPELASGDDVFLLHRMKHLQKNIEVLNSNDSLALTPAPANFKEFLKQRARWGSKAPHYNDFDTIQLSLVVLFTNLLLLGGLIAGIVSSSMELAVIGFLIKFSADTFLFLSGNRFFRLGANLLLIPLLEFFYPIYILIMAILIIKKPFDWKGRKL
jgi:biofilm PGA synthesis N-glycosyltransferase PgaC